MCVRSDVQGAIKCGCVEYGSKPTARVYPCRVHRTTHTAWQQNIESGLHCNTLCKHWGRGEEALLVAASLSVNIDLHTFRAKLLDLGDAHLIYQTIRYRPLLSTHR